MNPDPRPSPPAARWSWWGVVAMGVIVLAVPTLLALGPAPRRPFDEKPLRLLKKERAAVVLLGDSMLDTRIDPKVLNGLAGQRCYVLAQPGSSSAAWYLMFKNLVAVQTPPPRAVIILYRSRQLTLPSHRAVGDYRKSMEPYMRDAEPVLEKLVGPVRKSTGLLDDMVHAVYPLDRVRERAQDKMQAWALDLVASSREYEEIHNSAKELFSPQNLRVGTVVDEQQEGGATSLDPNEHEFSAHVDASFLPPLLEIAREKGIQLVFYKVKRRPNPDGTLGEESVTSEDYDQALRAYVEKAGARFFDETHEPDITVDLYGSGDHVAPAMMPRYTELFWKKVGKLVNAEPGPMIFHSLQFLVFLVIVLTVYWAVPARWRNALLVPASVIFYGFVHPWFLLPFATTTIIDYFVARGIDTRPDRKKLLVGVSVVSNLGLLGVFKYYNFFIENVAALLTTLHLPVSLPVLQVVLPAGISFYTFQSIGYVVDVSRGHVRACRSFRDYALFVSFFPQLVAGPIQRAGHLLTQIQSARIVTPAIVGNALVLMSWGFFKKLVIADNVAITANKIFAMESPSFAMLWTGVFAFCIQIFADFSAYTDIARGTARLFGFDLSPNFNHPYIADSPSDFWRRWHISLSTWIRDYVFIPLGGSRQGSGRTTINLIIVFLLTGIWHGASWNFALWGLYYAVLTIIYRAAAAITPTGLQTFPGLRVVKILIMFALTNIGWLIFREQNVHQLWRHLTLSPAATPASDWRVAAYLSTLTALFALPLVLHTIWDTTLRERWQRWSGWPRVAWTAATVVSLALFVGILFLRSDTSQDFIYFQF